MSATNNTGYEIQEYSVEFGWVTELTGYSSFEEGQKVLSTLPPDKVRRVYESLEGY